MFIRSACMVLVMSAVFTIPAFGQTQQDCPLGDVNCFFNLSTSYDQTQSYDSARQQDEILKRMLKETQPSENPYRDSMNECGFFWQGNQQAMDDCVQRHQ